MSKPSRVWVELLKKQRDRIVCVTCGRSQGTGSIVGDHPERDGFLVLTAMHVVDGFLEEGGEVVELRREGCGSAIEGEIRSLVFDRELDIAVLEVLSVCPAEPLRLGLGPDVTSGKTVQLASEGSEIGVLGYAEASCMLFGEPRLTFCQGRIAAWGYTNSGHAAYLVDGRVNRGMSGGPVWGVNGQVLGMVTAYCSPGVEGFGDEKEAHAWPGFGVVLPVDYMVALTSKMGCNIVQPAGFEAGLKSGEETG